MKKLPTILFLLISLNLCPASTWWVGQTATGAGTGADTNNLMSLATVNSSWPASPGDTINLCGVITR